MQRYVLARNASWYIQVLLAWLHKQEKAAFLVNAAALRNLLLQMTAFTINDDWTST